MAFLQLLVSYQQWRKEIIYWGDPIDNGNSMMMTYLNYHNRPTLNVSFSISPAIGFWHPNLNIGVKKQWMTIDGIEFNKPRPTIRFNNTFELPGDFLVSLDGLLWEKEIIRICISSKIMVQLTSLSVSHFKGCLKSGTSRERSFSWFT